MPWLLQWLFTLIRSRRTFDWDLALENLALRQQVALLQRQTRRPTYCSGDRVFWILLRRLWPRRREICLLPSPSTVVAWHRAGFKRLWKWKSRRRPGRPHLRPQLIELIQRMARENPIWGSPRIHGELRMLGLRVSQATVSRYMARSPRPSPRGPTWKAFLSNHREHIAAMDFFTVPTATFRQLYGLVILHHGKRTVAHANVTAHPTAEWVRQQLREAFPADSTPKYLIFDRDAIFAATKACIRNLGIQPKVIAYRSPWQNGVVERFIGTLRRELLDHIIVRDEGHLLRLLKEYVAHYHEDRTHLGLEKETPGTRPREHPPDAPTELKAQPKLGGLHHRYSWNRAA